MSKKEFDLNKFKRPGIYIQEKDISYTTPEGGYFCKSCCAPKGDFIWSDESYCGSCRKETGLLSKPEMIKKQRNDKIDKLI